MLVKRALGVRVTLLGLLNHLPILLVSPTAPTPGKYMNVIFDNVSSILCHIHCQWLTHWGRVTHICVGNLIIIGPDNGLSPGRRQAIIWTNAGILLIGSLGTDFIEIWIKIKIFSLKKMRLKMSSAKRQPFCLGLNVLSTLTIESYIRPNFSQRKPRHM